QQLNENVPRETKNPEKQKDVFIKEREHFLRERFGTSVNIKQNKNKGKIEIEFFSKEDLERILEMLHKDDSSI
ncbi:MAG: chromosome partitioning protein ParB, partial [Bacillus sp. (in: firmicutes)]